MAVPYSEWPRVGRVRDIPYERVRRDGACSKGGPCHAGAGRGHDREYRERVGSGHDTVLQRILCIEGCTACPHRCAENGAETVRDHGRVRSGGIRTRFGESAGDTLDPVLKPDSWYRSLEQRIRARAGASQLDATPADRFAEKLVAALLRKRPPVVFRYGRKSFMLPFLGAVLPRRMRDRLLMKMFGLSELKSADQDRDPPAVSTRCRSARA